VASLSNEEIYNYIFKDNFSTKDKVTQTSGRGVGMSAVKTELYKLNGTVKIQSEINVGTTFVFNIPM
jgi:two-component system chemotaxis sensor kinase CheA